MAGNAGQLVGDRDCCRLLGRNHTRESRISGAAREVAIRCCTADRRVTFPNTGPGGGVDALRAVPTILVWTKLPVTRSIVIRPNSSPRLDVPRASRKKAPVCAFDFPG